MAMRALAGITGPAGFDGIGIGTTRYAMAWHGIGGLAPVRPTQDYSSELE